MAFELLMPAWARWTLGIVLAILVLLVMITVHEFGHYLAGKFLHFGIDEFSIGFGPALFKRKRKKTGELFSVRLIPLGGYCSFREEDGLGSKEEASKPAAEGPAEAPKEGTEELIEGAAEPVKEEKIEQKPQNGVKKRLTYPDNGNFVEMKPWKRIVVLLSGAFMNYLLALVLLLVSTAAYGQTLVGVRYVEPTEEFAAENVLSDRDVFLKADGKGLYLTTDLAAALNGKKKGELVEMEILRVTGEDGSRTRMTVEIAMREDVKVKNSTDLDGVWQGLGVKYMETEEGEGYYAYGVHMQRFGFFETIGRSFVYSFKIAGSIFRVIGELLTGRLGIGALGGPVTTIATTASVASQSFRGLLEISGYIGVNLAVFNLLPIPALDGSKVVFTLIEWVRGRPISRKVEAVIHAVGFVVLILFAVLVDILQFVI